MLRTPEKEPKQFDTARKYVNKSGQTVFVTNEAQRSALLGKGFEPFEKKAKEKEPPAGYRWEDGVGGDLMAIPGGPALKEAAPGPDVKGETGLRKEYTKASDDYSISARMDTEPLSRLGLVEQPSRTMR